MDTEFDELDRRIAEAVGWRDVRWGPLGRLIGRSPATRLEDFDDVSPFSRNMESAWSVARHLWTTRHLYITLIGGGDYYRAEFDGAPDSARTIGAGEGATPAEAICRAALDALADQEDR